jgi:CMP-N-acetylneuraminic acid synthetase
MTAARRICVIPAKGLSTRLPRKNVLPLAGHPLIAYAIRKGLTLGLFDRVVVSTEDDEIMEIAARYGADVPFRRPRELAVDPATIADVCVHLLDWYEAEQGLGFDTLVLLLPTSPLVLKSDIAEAITDFEAHGSQGCLLGVCQTEQPPFTTQLMEPDGRLQPAFPDSPYKDSKSNECPPAFHSNGCVAVVESRWLRQRGSFYGPETRGFVMPRIRSVDIDTREDYELALALYQLASTPKDKDLI